MGVHAEGKISHNDISLKEINKSSAKQPVMSAVIWVFYLDLSHPSAGAIYAHLALRKPIPKNPSFEKEGGMCLAIFGNCLEFSFIEIGVSEKWWNSWRSVWFILLLSDGNIQKSSQANRPLSSLSRQAETTNGLKMQPSCCGVQSLAQTQIYLFF